MEFLWVLLYAITTYCITKYWNKGIHVSGEKKSPACWENHRFIRSIETNWCTKLSFNEVALQQNLWDPTLAIYHQESEGSQLRSTSRVSHQKIRLVWARVLWSTWCAAFDHFRCRTEWTNERTGRMWGRGQGACRQAPQVLRGRRRGEGGGGRRNQGGRKVTNAMA